MVDWRVGLGMTAWWVPATILSNIEWMGHRDADYFGLTQFQFMNALHIFSWAAQFMGHGLFEKRAPAITTNLKFALLAPFFITFEVMNAVFGF